MFSEMVVVMRDLMADRFRRENDRPIVGALAFGSMPAANIAHTFFAICWELKGHNASEDTTVNALGVEVHKVIRQRNDVAHGDWYMAAMRVRKPDPDEPITLAKPFAFRIDPARKKKPFQTITRDLDADSDNIDRLADLLRDYGRACFGAHPNGSVSVADVIRLRSKVVVPGPKAAFALPSQIPVDHV